MTRALIAVPAYPVLATGRVQGWSYPGVGVPEPYLAALHRAGAREAVFQSVPLADTDAEALLARTDGLLLLGGGDVDPAHYGATPGETVYGVDADRDACEIALARAATRRRVPVLAICRGHQVLAVALGATLHQHITDAPGLGDHGRPGVHDSPALHAVEVTPGSRLAHALGTTRATGSSHHHQAVDDPGPDLVVTALGDDGVVEAVELADPDGPWVVGVQWHPEDTAAADPVQQRLFDRFVAECATAAAPRSRYSA